MSDPKPSEKLRTLAEYIVLVYAPAMFQIKYQSSIVYGAIHLTQMIQNSRFLPTAALKIVQENISRNAYFAHPENLTLTMLNDNNEAIRRKGWLSILSARESAIDGDPVRVFRVPKINFPCTNYTELIDYDNAIHTNPPILRDLPITRADLETLASKKILDHDFGSYLNDMPLHTQSVERSAKLVTGASTRVCSEKARDGLILSTLASRANMPTFQSKQDFDVSSNKDVLKHFSV